MKRIFISMLLMLFSALSVHASEAEFNETLVQIINQINAINPLLEEARSQQAKNTRIKLHIDRFQGSDNKSHNGLQEDLNAIKQSLIAYINKPAVEPRKITPLQLDYVDSPTRESTHG